jgi:outer membrane receptor protein involved in Fe transport
MTADRKAFRATTSWASRTKCPPAWDWLSTWAAFASADWLIGDKLTVTTGLRYTDDQIDFKE